MLWRSFLTSSIRCLILAACLLFTTLSSAKAEKASVENIIRNKPYSRIVVSAHIKGAFTREIVDTIQSGAPVTFTYFIELERIREILWDKTVRKLAIRRMVKYDTLRKEYIAWEKRAEKKNKIDFKAELDAMEYKEKNIINEPPKSGKTVEDNKSPEPAIEPDTFTDIDQLNEWMTRLDKIDLGATDGLETDAVYYTRIKSEMKTIKLIPPFNYILFFVSLWNFDTDWGESDWFKINGEHVEKPGPEDRFADTE